MDTKTRLLVSLGSSYAAGCIPCFDYYFMLAKEEKIMDDEINQVIAVARKVRNGSDIALEKAISDLMNSSGVHEKSKRDFPDCKCC